MDPYRAIVNRWFETQRLEEAASYLELAERKKLDLELELVNERTKHNKTRAELDKARIAAAAAERARAGYDEAEFDATKQRGVGAIPIGGDFSQLEAIEEQLGMAPTLDQQLAKLGLGAPGAEQARALMDAAGAGGAERPRECDPFKVHLYTIVADLLQDELSTSLGGLASKGPWAGFWEQCFIHHEDRNAQVWLRELIDQLRAQVDRWAMTCPACGSAIVPKKD